MNDLSMVIDAVLDQARGLIPATPGELEIHAKDDGSPVTVVDVKVQRLIVARLRDFFGGEIGVLAEEDGCAARAALDHDIVVVCDPIDGTGLLIRGQTTYSVGVAVVAGGQVTSGVDLPALGWRAVGGDRIVLVNGAPGRLPAPHSRRFVRVAARHSHADLLPRYLHDGRRVRSVQAGGVASMLMLLVMGLADAMIVWPPDTYPGCGLWDVLPASTLMPALGVQVRGLEGDEDLTVYDPTIYQGDPPRWTDGIIAGPPDAVRDLRGVLPRVLPRID